MSVPASFTYVPAPLGLVVTDRDEHDGVKADTKILVAPNGGHPLLHVKLLEGVVAFLLLACFCCYAFFGLTGLMMAGSAGCSPGGLHSQLIIGQAQSISSRPEPPRKRGVPVRTTRRIRG